MSSTQTAHPTTGQVVTLGERMKSAEHAYRRQVQPHQYLLLRLDGRAFHSYTRGLGRPYDLDLMAAMDATLLALCEEIQGVRLGYVESDEISLLVTDWTTRSSSDSNPDGVQVSQPWMGGVEAKILSLSAAQASVAFGSAMRRRWEEATSELRATEPFRDSDPKAYATIEERCLRLGAKVLQSQALFDSRLWTFPSTEQGRREVANYFLWRQRDAVKNSVTMAAHVHFSHRQLHGINTDQKQDLLRSAGAPWEDLPSGFRNGRIAVRREQTGTVTYTDKRTGTQHTTAVTRRPFVIEDAPDFGDLIAAEMSGLFETTVPTPYPA